MWIADYYQHRHFKKYEILEFTFEERVKMASRYIKTYNILNLISFSGGIVGLIFFLLYYYLK